MVAVLFYFYLVTGVLSSPDVQNGIIECPVNSTWLGKFSDGWSFMTDNTPMYLTRRTFNPDPKGRNLTACVSANTTRADNTTNEVEQTLTYYNLTSCKWLNFTKNYTAYSFYSNETVRNAFNSSIYDITLNLNIQALSCRFMFIGKPVTYPVVYTDHECLLTYLPYRGNDSVACEVWVKGSYFENSSETCCDKIFDQLCAPMAQIMYNATQCNILNDPAAPRAVKNKE
ncbi:hypothetical protein V5799_008981 [Amblyomma americanum]|uniref:Lipocalin n=1 Tax=Amblyomma americanum TaxID=6943 RepID=A0AAQ4FBI5_AMBAM